MNTELAHLLERLIEQNDEIRDLLWSIDNSLKDVHGELSWTESLSFASQVLQRLDQIEANGG